MQAITTTHLVIGAAAFAVIVAAIFMGRDNSGNSSSRIDIDFDAMKDEETKRHH